MKNEAFDTGERLAIEICNNLNAMGREADWAKSREKKRFLFFK